MLKRCFLLAVLAILLISSIAFGQIYIPPVEGGCVPVDPTTGAPCPECCGGKQTTEKPDEECSPPALTDCTETCTVSVEKGEACVEPVWKNCRQECAGLPSYPTYEFEACLVDCDNQNIEDRNDYDECIAQKQVSTNKLDQACFSQCEADNTRITQDYEQCLENKKAQKKEPVEEPLKPKEPVQRKATSLKPEDIALEEYGIWDNGKLKEEEMEDVVDEYFKEAKCPWNKLPAAWSAAFISYVMKEAGIDFPSNCNHVNYFRSIKNKPGVCKTHPMKEIEKIQPGDIICGCRKAKKTDPPCKYNYDSLPSGEPPAHCDIVTSKRSDGVTGIGGNVADSVSESDIKFSKPELFGFITCREKSSVSGIKGDAKIRKGSGEWAELKEGTVLSAGHMVGVGKGGSASVMLEDGTTIDVAENAAVTVIDSDTYNIKTGSEGNAIIRFKDGGRVELSKNSEFVAEAENAGFLKEGIVEAVFDKLKCAVDRCLIRTATATLAVRGTEYSLSHDIVSNATQVTLREGELYITDQLTGQTKSFAAPATVVIDEKGINEETSLFRKHPLLSIISLAVIALVAIRVLHKFKKGVKNR